MKTMKTISQTLFLAIALFIFVSCKDSDENSITPTDQLLEGAWSYEAAEIELTVNGQNIIDYLIEIFELTEAQAAQIADMIEENSFQFNNASWEFNHDNTFTVVDEDERTTGTWNLSDDKKKLSLTTEEETDIVDVLVLTATKLQVLMTYDEEVDIDEDGIDETLKIEGTLKLKK